MRNEIVFMMKMLSLYLLFIAVGIKAQKKVGDMQKVKFTPMEFGDIELGPEKAGRNSLTLNTGKTVTIFFI